MCFYGQKFKCNDQKRLNHPASSQDIQYKVHIFYYLKEGVDSTMGPVDCMFISCSFRCGTNCDICDINQKQNRTKT